jgi:predicted nucleic acid-binding protein
LEELSENNGSFITSTITITEFLAGTTSSNLSTLHMIPKLTFILLEEEVAEQAALLQRKNKLQIGDAIHLATALSQNTDLFFSNDKELNKVVSGFITIRQL